MKKNILIIGGSSGIGSSLLNKISHEHNVYVACRSNDSIPENVNYIKYDVLNDELDTTSIPESIDGFVYLPGSINLRPFKSLSIESFKEDLEINKLKNQILNKKKNEQFNLYSKSHLLKSL